MANNKKCLLKIIHFQNMGVVHIVKVHASRTMFCCSVTLSCLVLCDPYGLQYTRLPCPSLSPGVCSNSCPLSQWCYPTISSFVVPFSPCPQSFPASGSFPMSRLFTSGGQSIGASALAWGLPMHFQGWLPLRLTGLISLLSQVRVWLWCVVLLNVDLIKWAKRICA